MSSDITWIDVQFLAADMLRWHPFVFFAVGAAVAVLIVSFGRWIVRASAPPAYVRKRYLRDGWWTGAGR